MDDAQEAFAQASVGILDDLFHRFVYLFASSILSHTHLTECYRGDGGRGSGIPKAKEDKNVATKK